MKAIYASKLYQASKRKDRIQAAIMAPSNLALVQQLAEDLDEKYQTPENLGAEDESSQEGTTSEQDNLGLDEFVVDEEINPETDLVTMDDISKTSGNQSVGSKHKLPNPSSNNESKDQSKDSGSESKDSSAKPEGDNSNLMPESPANEQKPAESSTNVAQDKEKIKATTIADLTTLKNTLNSREDTCGVARVAEKENEVWIYYKDEINLNDIMTNVIECLMDSEYANFEFNRLARSDNAIVFVREKSTEPDLESINSNQEKS